MNRHTPSILAGLSLFILLLVGSLLGILSDKQEYFSAYYMTAGNVAIELSVDTQSNESVPIAPNQTTPLSVGITNVGTEDCYVFVKTVIPKINGIPILSISPTGNWIKLDDDVYEYTVDGELKMLESGDTTAEMIAEARFYDFTELTDFNGTMQIIAYAVQTDGFENAEVADIWSATVRATGE